MKSNHDVACGRLVEIIESIELIEEWSKDVTQVNDFMTSPLRVMAFNACVMRLQVIGEHVGKLLKSNAAMLAQYEHIPWLAIYDMRNLISHEYSNIDESIIYSVIKEDLPVLKEAIREMMDDL